MVLDLEIENSRKGSVDDMVNLAWLFAHKFITFQIAPNFFIDLLLLQ
jgi:hypothetical protein